eukprot:13012739-Ditylum_brightwellii.AAC.1
MSCQAAASHNDTMPLASMIPVKVRNPYIQHCSSNPYIQICPSQTCPTLPIINMPHTIPPTSQNTYFSPSPPSPSEAYMLCPSPTTRPSPPVPTY